MRIFKLMNLFGIQCKTSCVQCPITLGPVAVIHFQPPKARMATDDPGDNDAEDAAGVEEALKKYRMIDARLRRLCELKPSGKCKVPQSIHDAWKKGGTSQDELRVWLDKLDLDKDLYM